MRTYKVTFKLVGRPDNYRFPVEEVHADNYRTDSGLVSFYCRDGADEVNVYSAQADRVHRIELM